MIGVGSSVSTTLRAARAFRDALVANVREMVDLNGDRNAGSAPV